jgi:phage-related protein
MAVELGAGYISTFPKLDAQKTRSATNDLENQLERAGDDGGRRAGDGFAGSFGAGIKKAIGLAVAAFAGLELGRQLAGAVGAASDLNETLSKTAQIFGQDALPELVAFAKGADRALGQSQQSALDAAATFGVFGKSAGLTGRELGKFSTDMVTLASDLASFGNTSPEEAIEALGAALRGESEPIRRYGVLLDEATLRNRALALGIISSTKEALTPQQKVLAAQAEILAQTSDAQGDFARTSDGLANQQRILNALWQNGKAQLGEALLPAVLAVVSFLVNEGIPGFQNFAREVREAFRAFAESEQVQGALAFLRENGPVAFNAVRDAAREARDVLVEVFDFVVEHQDAFAVAAAGVAAFAGAVGALAAASQAASAVGGLASSAGLLGKILPILATPAGIVVALIAALGVAAFVAYKKFEPFRNAVDTVARTIRDVALKAFEEFRPVAESAFDKASTAAGTAKDAFIAVKDAVVGFVDDARGSLEPFVAWFQEHVTPTLSSGWDLVTSALDRVQQQFNNLRTVVETVMNALLPIVTPVLTLLSGAFDAFINVVTPLWNGFWNTVQIVASTAFNIVRVVVETVLGVIRGIFQTVTGIIDGDWSKFWEGIKTIASSLFNGAREIISTILDTIKRIFAEAFDAVKGTVTRVLDEVIGFLGGVAGRATTALGDLLGTLVQKGRDLIQGLRNGIEAVFGEVTGFLGGIAGKVLDAVGNLGSVLYDAGRDVIGGLVDGLWDAAPDVSAPLKWVTDKLPDWKGPADLDKRILRPSGRWVLEGFTAGLKDVVPQVRAELGNVTSLISATVAPSLVAPSPVAAPQPVAVGPSKVEVALVLDGRTIQKQLVSLERSAR